jgi:hypothetical protein
MSASLPQTFQWDGEHMVPLRPKLADREYCVGEIYRLGVIEERSTNSHRHFFAALNEAWVNLSDELAEQYPSAEKLRKVALIRTGWCDTHTLVCRSNADAQRVATFMRPIDEWAVIEVRGATVTRYTAKSQSERAMGKADFERSKQSVLDFVSAMIGTTPEELRENAGAGI